MEVYLNNISGIASAMTSMYISKRHIDREKEKDIISLVEKCTDRRGFLHTEQDEQSYIQFTDKMNRMCEIGKNHTTLLRFIDFEFMVYGMHRAGQDDWDAHACRYNNRIVRSSTRLATYGDEFSDYYKGKIMTTEQAMRDVFGIEPVEEFTTEEGKTYVKSTNGYVLKEYADDKDVKRGLYMLSIPSNFIFRVNLTEWAHVYKERNINGGANPEVKELCEKICNLLETAYPQFTRELFSEIKN